MCTHTTHTYSPVLWRTRHKCTESSKGFTAERLFITGKWQFALGTWLRGQEKRHFAATRLLLSQADSWDAGCGGREAPPSGGGKSLSLRPEPVPQGGGAPSSPRQSECQQGSASGPAVNPAIQDLHQRTTEKTERDAFKKCKNKEQKYKSRYLKQGGYFKLKTPLEPAV